MMRAKSYVSSITRFFAITLAIQFLAACDSIQVSEGVRRISGILPSVETIVTREVYPSSYRLPEPKDTQWIAANHDWEEIFAVVAPGVLRFEVNPKDENKHYIYHIVIEDPSYWTGIRFECKYTDIALKLAVSRFLPECTYDPGFKVAQQQATTPINAPASGINECLKSWDLRWEAPADMSLTAECKSPTPDTANSGRLFLAEMRRTIIALNYRRVVEPDLREDRGREDTIAFSIYLDRFFQQQGFIRTDATTDDWRGAAVPATSTYQRNASTGPIRIHLRFEPNMLHATMSLETVPGLKNDARLPTPNKAYNLFEKGRYGPWFALPGARFTEEHIGRGAKTVAPIPEHDPTTFVTPYWHYLKGKKEIDGDLIGKVFHYEYPTNIRIFELFAAYRAALRNAGWILGEERLWPNQNSIQATFDLPDRRLLLALNVDNLEGGLRVQATLTDPVFAGQIEVISEPMNQFGAYVFMPTFNSSQQPITDTEFQLTAIEHYLRPSDSSPNKGILLIPSVSYKYLKDPGALAKAKADVLWVAQALRKRAWPENQIRILETPVFPNVETEEFTHGVEVTHFQCQTENEIRPYDTVTSCVCYGNRKTIATTAGKCP